MAKAPPESEIEDSGNNKTYDFNSPPQSFACPGGRGGVINLKLRLGGGGGGGGEGRGGEGR